MKFQFTISETVALASLATLANAYEPCYLCGSADINYINPDHVLPHTYTCGIAETVGRNGGIDPEACIIQAQYNSLNGCVCSGTSKAPTEAPTEAPTNAPTESITESPE